MTRKKAKNDDFHTLKKPNKIKKIKKIKIKNQKNKNCE
jgi:hypothetical protein